ncbi:MAG: endonuclease/exonuclease/phosphatase family protein [Peptococcaceae bacterium]|nr:endonuclease/exonuclease/phosphatase family protein [Peptococcaceae bacterium]
MKRILLFIGFLLSLPFLFLGYVMLTDYRPAAVTALAVSNNQNIPIKKGEPLSALTFNIGYCGLDENQDFFVDGGSMSRSRSKEQTRINLQKIASFIARQNSSFILLQEVDVNSSRSYNINQFAALEEKLPDYGSTFGLNYKVAWVPVPLTRPMGSVTSGLATFSRKKITSGTRYQYPGHEKWPKQLFELDRCFIETRLPVEDGHELILINSHLSAFDEGGRIRKEQLKFLKEYIVNEFGRGNYIIVGGDWNHVLPGTGPDKFETTEKRPFWLQDLPDDFTPNGFNWAVDPSIPSVRTVASPYRKGMNFTAVIDGFLVSNNIKVTKVFGQDLGFANSDHNPVICQFILQ